MTTPACPYELGDAGAAWWAWAWSTPQAKRWDEGALYTIARRACLEDLADVLDEIQVLSIGDIDRLINGDPETAGRRLGWLLKKLRTAAGGFTDLSREMRELEGQLGFGAKSLAALGWAADSGSDGETGDEVERARKRRADRLAGQSTAGTPTPS